MMTHTRLATLGAVMVGMILFAAPASAQEAILTEAATQPAVGRLVYRGQAFWTRYRSDPDTGRSAVSDAGVDHRFSVGLSPKLSLTARFATMHREPLGSAGDDTTGITDTSLALKWRFWQRDSGAIDTNRLALVGGVDLPTGTEDLSSHSVDPFIGLVFSSVFGRSGFNQTLRYQFNTGTVDDAIAPGMGRADLFEYRSAYLYRLAPAAFDADSHGAFYGVVELEGLLESNGDHEILLAPGVMYEAARWVAEASVRLPVYREVDERLETDFGIVLGVRLLF